MKTQFIGMAAAALLSTGAFAQVTQNSHNPSVKNNDTAHVAAPAEGANSFTQDQAKGRLAKAGYTGISALAKDKNGVWRGTAMRAGKKVNVGLDYKGNVVTR